ncbi:hypothetical protein BH11PSE11_BH11PSE11_29560 [soil metagenome]
MLSALSTFERRARYLACLGMLLLGLVLLAMQFGLITTAPAYKSEAWYADAPHSAGFIVISEFADESECRAKVGSSASCQSGKSLIDRMGRAHAGRSSGPG